MLLCNGLGVMLLFMIATVNVVGVKKKTMPRYLILNSEHP